MKFTLVPFTLATLASALSLSHVPSTINTPQFYSPGMEEKLPTTWHVFSSPHLQVMGLLTGTPNTPGDLEVAVIPGDSPGGPAIVDLGTQTGTSLMWVVNVAPGTIIALDLRDSAGLIALSAPRVSLRETLPKPPPPWALPRRHVRPVTHPAHARQHARTIPEPQEALDGRLAHRRQRGPSRRAVPLAPPLWRLRGRLRGHVGVDGGCRGGIVDTVAARCEAWTKVAGFLPVLVSLRREERERTKAVEGELDDL
ncbi:hypothetical protein NLJ89_g9168 [Agrocybe chaxingu]|uniref:Uncharacterized protein n=1 Tax=Agrocybe chaxingu TaxID=84603 RepID=A0A9W8JTU4_9AGAR|nr:hypothetical protein NLJ89_g9168 [Agrocybe chaxingu]